MPYPYNHSLRCTIPLTPSSGGDIWYGAAETMLRVLQDIFQEIRNSTKSSISNSAIKNTERHHKSLYFLTIEVILYLVLLIENLLWIWLPPLNLLQQGLPKNREIKAIKSFQNIPKLQIPTGKKSIFSCSSHHLFKTPLLTNWGAYLPTYKEQI